MATSFSRNRWCSSLMLPLKVPVPTRVLSTVYIRTSKQRDFGSTFFANSAASCPCGPHGPAGAPKLPRPAAGAGADGCACCGAASMTVAVMPIPIPAINVPSVPANRFNIVSSSRAECYISVRDAFGSECRLPGGLLELPFNPLQQTVERGAVKHSTANHHRADASNVGDVIERVGIKKHEVGVLAGLDAAQCGLQFQVPRRIDGGSLQRGRR